MCSVSIGSSLHQTDFAISPPASSLSVLYVSPFLPSLSFYCTRSLYSIVDTDATVPHSLAQQHRERARAMALASATIVQLQSVHSLPLHIRNEYATHTEKPANIKMITDSPEAW